MLAFRRAPKEACTIAKLWSKEPSYTPDFAKAYEASVMFLAAPPVASLPFPSWLLKRHVAKQCEV